MIEKLPDKIELWDGIDPVKLEQKLKDIYPVLLYDKIQELINVINDMEIRFELVDDIIIGK